MTPEDTNPLFIGIDPLFHSNVKLTVHNVLLLEPYTPLGIYCFHGHFIRHVAICGIIVGKEQNYNYSTITVDDGTGTLPCTNWTASHASLFSLGQSVFLSGRVVDIRNHRHISVQTCYQTQAKDEIIHTLEAIYLHRSVYAKPHRISDHLKRALIHYEETCTVEDQDRRIHTEEYRSTFEMALLDYWKTHLSKGTYSYTISRQDSNLVALAESLLAKVGTTKERDITRLFEETTLHLVDSGDLLCQDKEAGLYFLLPEDKLQQTIVSIIKKVATHYHHAVYQAYIIQSVLDVPFFSSLKPDRIRSFLQHLVTQSVLYKSTSSQYSLVDED
ncbi:hypothetical protein BDF14DRAFT_1804293 [Spinellus fusiger]|nr:hypothetical protein BDF14DRAFT_1804293 [Spinellus fusiger]